LNARERFLRYMHYQKCDRPPFYEFLGYWGETCNRWYGEGLPIGMNIYDYFNFDKRENIPIDFGPIPRFVPRTLEEDERYRIARTDTGIVKKDLKTQTSMATFIDFPIKKRDDWEKIKKRFDPYDKRRYPITWSDELLEYYKTIDRPIGLGMTGFFGEVRNLMGLERLLISFYRDPNWVREIMDFWADFLIETSRQALKEAKIDYVTIWEDMAYKNGPHVSPKIFSEFMLPNYKKVTDFIRAHGIDIIMVDTDGNFEALTPLFLEGGVNLLYPLEVASDMDAVTLRKKYGRCLLIIGNIDKRTLTWGKEAIEKEADRKFPLMNDGGYVPSVDHAVPSDVSFQNYLYYINLLKNYISKISEKSI